MARFHTDGTADCVSNGEFVEKETDGRAINSNYAMISRRLSDFR
jgi:hypothetical protein